MVAFKRSKKTSRRRGGRGKTRKTRKTGGAFKWTRPWHSLKKGIFKRVSKRRYSALHNKKDEDFKKAVLLRQQLAQQMQAQSSSGKSGRSASYPFDKKATVKQQAKK